MPAFYRDFLNKPQALNHFQTMNRYWMEDTHGKYGVQLDAFGPYQLPGNSYQYFEQNFGGASALPDAGHDAVQPLTSAPTPRRPGSPTSARLSVSSYDNIFYVSAGEDESSTWQEFGNMKFLNQDMVPDAFGPKPYRPVAAQLGSDALCAVDSWASVLDDLAERGDPGPTPRSSIEAESSGLGTYTHELTHNLGILDNYNNPYGTPQQRSATGPWDMMSRGSFGGPGGTHQRFLIPPTTGGSLGSQHNLRNKLKLGFITPNQVLRLNRGGLAKTGMVVADVTAREVDPERGLSGVRCSSTAPATTRLRASWPPTRCATASTKAANGTINGKYNAYMAEVVQQIGSDSFDPGHGVLLAKAKTAESNSCGTFTCFDWVIDSHPADINMVDFVGPDGTPNMVTIADQRQLDDATFNAGTDSGSTDEYEDTANRLHFYIVDKTPTPTASCTTRSGAVARRHRPADARRLGGPGLGRGERGRLRDLHVPADRTRARRGDRPVAPTRGRDAFVNGDVYRLSAIGYRHRLGRPAQEPAGDGEVRRDDPRAGVLHARRGRGLGDADGDVGLRPVEAASATCATGDVGGSCRRRCR